MTSPTERPAWQALTQHATSVPDITDCLDDATRNAHLRRTVGGLHVDASKQRVTAETLNLLFQLGEQAGIATSRKALLSGGLVNESEQRAALHTALRAPAGSDLAQHSDTVQAALAQLQAITTQLREGSKTSAAGKAIKHVVHIGIGGSHLGPELVVNALGNDQRFDLHFVANIDGDALHRALSCCDPERTAFIVVSKSFGTLETLTNAQTARSWLLERTGDKQAVREQFFAISANIEAASDFGLDPANVLPMWDWVGGRYSLWSAVGMPIALACGWSAFDRLLAGAHLMDEHFANASPDDNVPLLMALLGVWNSNFLGANNHAVLAYDERLELLPLYLQQLETESNGKSVHRDGTDVQLHTMPILWGGVGSTGQHAYHQLLHQGTRAYSADYIVCNNADHPYLAHHTWLKANALAQSQAMMLGDDTKEAVKRVKGNHPTTTFVLDRLSPENLGTLLALYEHKVFCQGVLWDINSFDQWGVELGKRLANPIFKQLHGGTSLVQDDSTRHLISTLKDS